MQRCAEEFNYGVKGLRPPQPISLSAPTLSPIFRVAQAIFRAKPFHAQYPTFPTAVTLHAYLPMKMEQTGCSETLALKLQTPVNNSEESIRQLHPNCN
jgi:hypothetical protein